MEKILVLVHTEPDGSLASPAREAVSAGKQMSVQLGGAPWAVGLVGEQLQAAAAELAACGAQEFVSVEGAQFAVSRYATDAAAAEAIGRAAQATIILAAGTTRWSRALPGVAARLQGRIDTHVTSLATTSGQPTVARWYYRQRMEAVLLRAQRPWIILVEPGVFAAYSGNPGAIRVKPVPVAVPESLQRTRVVGVQAPPADEQTIRPEAELLFVAGAGWTKKQADGQAHVQEAEAIISGFLRQARASLGSSKSLVDLGGEGQAVLSFLSHLNQIGQTGATPRHAKGLATCCHGEEPHTVGWRFINERRAINLDPNCGWARGKADVLYVADAFAVMSKVNALLAARAVPPG